MYESPIITAEIKSQKGFFVGDPCYALTRSMYENLWGKQHGYKDGVFIDPVSRLTFAVAGTAEGDGCYRGSDDSNFPVDSGTIGIIPLELADREPGKGYGKYIRMPGTAKFIAEKGVFEITGPDGDVLTINTTWD